MSLKLKPYKELDEWIPLRKAVDYAIIDDYDDGQVMRQRFNNWAIRGLRKLNLNLLRIVKTVLIPISARTGTGRLPDDYRKYIAAGAYDQCGNFTLFSKVGLIEVQKEPKCKCDKCKCGHETTLCDSVTYERVEEVISIAGVPYTNVITRQLLTGTNRYNEQKEEWILIEESGVVEKRVSNKELVELDVLPCGCIEESEANVERLKNCGCCGVWEYFGGNSFCSDDYFSIDEDARLIHVGDRGVKYLYFKYMAFLPCVNGEVYIPAVSVECLAAWILWKRDQRRKIAETQKQLSYSTYKAERSEMVKNLFPIRLSVIQNALNLIPY